MVNFTVICKNQDNLEHTVTWWLKAWTAEEEETTVARKSLNITIFWNMMLCSQAESCQCFAGTCCFHLQGSEVELCYWIIMHHLPEGTNLKIQSENLISQVHWLAHGMASMWYHSVTACQLETKLTAAHTVQLAVDWDQNLLLHTITAASSYVWFLVLTVLQT